MFLFRRNSNNENATKRPLVGSGDHSGNANCRTESSALFRGIFGTFRGRLYDVPRNCGWETLPYMLRGSPNATKTVQLAKQKLLWVTWKHVNLHCRTVSYVYILPCLYALSSGKVNIFLHVWFLVCLMTLSKFCSSNYRIVKDESETAWEEALWPI
jgi:hypothetical protein